MSIKTYSNTILQNGSNQCLENSMDWGAWYSPWGRKESDMTERLHLGKTKQNFSTFPSHSNQKGRKIKGRQENWKKRKTLTTYIWPDIIYRKSWSLYQKREIKEIIPFTITSKRKKYLGINLTKNVKDLYSESCKTLMKELENDTKKWEDIQKGLISNVYKQLMCCAMGCLVA